MAAKTIMFQGTGSDVGKSLIVAGIGRYLNNQGYRVAPFKPQNMSNNSSVTLDGGEIGRAQNLQAMACGIKPSIHMNPILLKPEANHKSQIIVHGQIHSTIESQDYLSLKKHLLEPVLESFNQLTSYYDIVLVEGAGSPAEVNLRHNDIANMGFALASNVPVILIGDINRGGVIAQMVGTHAVLDHDDQAAIKGFIINKFRGNPRLFDEGFSLIERLTQWEGLGVIPWHEATRTLPAEDTLSLSSIPTNPESHLNICFLVLDRIANFDDLDPLNLHPDVCVKPLFSGEPIPPDTDLVIVPGSKSTRNDLELINNNGWRHDLISHYRRGRRILGLCGGYQILGRVIHDPNGYEGTPGSIEGLGLLDVETTMLATKKLVNVEAIHADSNHAFYSYEIHLGETKGPDCARPFAFKIGSGNKDPEGATSADRLVQGTYLHGLFVDDGFRTNYLQSFTSDIEEYNYLQSVNSALDEISNHIHASINMNRLFEMMR